jgi:hypothetical protein
MYDGSRSRDQKMENGGGPVNDDKKAKKRERPPSLMLRSPTHFDDFDLATELMEFFETGSKDSLIRILPHIYELEKDEANIVLEAAADYLAGGEPNARTIRKNRTQINLYERVESIIRGNIFSIYKNTKNESLLKGASIGRVLDHLVEENEAFGYKSHQSALNAYQAGKKLSGGVNRPQGRPKKT